MKVGYSSDQGSGSVRLRSGLSLPELQCMLDENGATDLVIDLIVGEPSHTVFLECLHLAIALLEGGNSSVQVGIVFYDEQMHTHAHTNINIHININMHINIHRQICSIYK